MMGAKKKIQNRIKRLEVLVEQEQVFCTKHREYLTMPDIYRHKCYTGNRGKTYCKYLRTPDYREK